MWLDLFLGLPKVGSGPVSNAWTVFWEAIPHIGLPRQASVQMEELSPYHNLPCLVDTHGWSFPCLTEAEEEWIEERAEGMWGQEEIWRRRKEGNCGGM